MPPALWWAVLVLLCTAGISALVWNKKIIIVIQDDTEDK